MVKKIKINEGKGLRKISIEKQILGCKNNCHVYLFFNLHLTVETILGNQMFDSLAQA